MSVAAPAKKKAVCFGVAPSVLELIREKLPADLELAVVEKDTEPAKATEQATGVVAVLASLSPGLKPPAALAAVLAAAEPSLGLVQLTLTGTENVPWDLVPAEAPVCNVFGMETGIAEFVLASIMHFNVGLAARSEQMSAHWGSWLPPWGQGAPWHAQRPELMGQTLGMVGYGHIGEQIVSRARAFGMRIVAVRSRDATPPEGVEWMRASSGGGLEELLRQSDYVAVCVDLNDSTRGMLNASTLRLMKKTAVLINIARAGIVVEADLYDACKEQVIGGAVLDVWWSYPTDGQPSGPPASCHFHELPNVVCSPHFSGWTDKFRARRVADAAANLTVAARGGGTGELKNLVHRPSKRARISE